MTIVIIDGNGDRQQTNNVRMVSSYPDYSIVYMKDGTKFEVKTESFQNFTCVDEERTSD